MTQLQAAPVVRKSLTTNLALTQSVGLTATLEAFDMTTHTPTLTKTKITYAALQAMDTDTTKTPDAARINHKTTTAKKVAQNTTLTFTTLDGTLGNGPAATSEIEATAMTVAARSIGMIEETGAIATETVVGATSRGRLSRLGNMILGSTSSLDRSIIKLLRLS